MKAYVINMRRSVERREYMKDVMSKMSYLDYEFLDAVDSSILRDEQKDRLVNKDLFIKRYLKQPSNGEIGVALSHQKLYRKVIRGKENYAFAFEDDVTINYDIERYLVRLKPLYDTDVPRIILFSGWFWYTKKVKYHFIQLGKVWDALLAHAYVINKAAAYKMKTKQICMYADDWFRFRKMGIQIYGIIPRAFDQEWGDLKTTIDHTNLLDKRCMIQKIPLYAREVERKMFEKAGYFETCSYLERK